MASIQSSILKLVIRRANFFGGEKADPQSVRIRIEKLAGRSTPPKGVQVVPVDAGPVPSEWLIPPDAPQDCALMYIHGGAWIMGSTRTHRGFVAKLARASGIRALSIDYRLAPENPFPAGLDDCVTAYEWLLENGISSKKLLVAGDSAGGNLTLALLIALRDREKPLPAGAIAISPATDLTASGGSRETRHHLDPYFSNMGTMSILDHYTKDHDPRHPLLSPLHADLSGLPPLLIHVGDHEILLDDAVRFGEKAVAAGVEAKTVVWSEMFHVFHIFAPFLPEARRANAEIAAFIESRISADLWNS